MRSVILVVVKCLLLGGLSVGCFCDADAEPGEPLRLTPLLEQGKVREAQRMSKVKPDIGNMTSYSGYFTVNKACESNLFFWFFPAQKTNWQQAPLVLFLQGGPGASSVYSLFEEIGPLTYKEELGRRQYSWNVENNLLIIDQPVGTGFSFTGKGCYAENETVIGTELYSAVIQFLQLFPNLVNNKFYITGYSYAGHFIPVLGQTIHKNNPTAKIKINLKGMMIGNGWMDALYQSDLGSYLYQLGLIDDAGRVVYYDYQNQFFQLMKEKKYQQALEVRTAIVDSVYRKYVGNVNILNYLEKNVLFATPYENFIQTPKIRKAIHVGNTNFSFVNPQVEKSLGVDAILSVKPEVEQLLEHYFIVFFYGQLDIICGYPMAVNFLRSLEWSGRQQYLNATRQPWCDGGEQPGYLKRGHNLYDVLVRGAGHSVMFDKPYLAYLLINSVTSSTSDALHALNVCNNTVVPT